MRFMGIEPEHISPIPVDEGGGYLISFPDLPGCMADGESIEDAVSEARDAFKAWMMAELEDQTTVPAPKTYSGQFVQRIPKSLHLQLAKCAENEGVSLNQLTATLLAQGVVRLTQPNTVENTA